MSANGTKQTPISTLNMSAFGGIVLQNSRRRRWLGGVGVGRVDCSAAVWGIGGRYIRRTRLTQRRRLAPSAVVVRHTWRAFSSFGRWRRAEPRRGRRSSPSAAAGRASGCASCGKQHLDFLALSARLLEGLGVGQRADAIAHLLVDVSRDLAHGPDGALGLQRAG